MNTDQTTLVDVLVQRAGATPDQLAIRFVIDDNTTQTLTYRELHQRAVDTAVYLQQHVAVGARAMLLLHSGLDYVAAFFGCLYAGVIAVPAYPPESKRPRHIGRLRSIVEDANATILLSSSAALADVDILATHCADAILHVVDILPRAQESDWCRPLLQHDSIAFLQYTSGSTSTPRGVQVSHGNIMVNERAIADSMGFEPTDVMMSWLPLFHDMGLIGCLLQCIHGGFPLILMSPQFFLARPRRWLEAITQYRATVSGGPDFAFQLCVDRINESMLRDIDLGSLRLLFSGSEPVRPATMRAFADKFSAAGLDPNVLHPCYGLAEATLFVAGNSLRGGVRAIAPPQPDHAGSGETGNTADIVCCGAVAAHHTVLIVDPVSGIELQQNAIGEIWVAGGSVAQGYWNNEEATRKTFVERSGSRYLRTGDLGFMCDQNLYVTGRLKDLIIIRGHNIYPQEIEQTVENEIEFVRKGRLAAFAVDVDGRETIGIAVEISRNVLKMLAPGRLATAISEAVALQFQEPASLVLLLNPGALPKTSSGKLQRSACRAGWQQGTLDIAAAFLKGRPVSCAAPSALATDAAATSVWQSEVEQDVAALWCEALDLAVVTRNDSFFALGGNSLAATQLLARTNEKYGCDLSLRMLFEAPTVADFARLIVQYRQPGVTLHHDVQIVRTENADNIFLQSYAQSRLWFLSQFDPESIAYNISATLQIAGPVDAALLQRSFDMLVQRHEILRTRFFQRGDRALQQIHDGLIVLQQQDLAALPEPAWEPTAKQILLADALIPFDLTRDTLMKIRLLSFGPVQHLLQIVIHHIVTDGWSMKILVDELVAIYSALHNKTDVTLRALPLRYVDFAVWQRSYLADDDKQGVRATQLAYWQDRLGQEHSPLRLPIDHVRPALQSHRGAAVEFSVPSSLVVQLNALAAAHNATLFHLLLSAFALLLSRYSAQRNIRIGVPVAGRNHPATQSLLGFFVNTQVMCIDAEGRQGFADLLAQVKHAALDAQAHQDLPFEQLVDALQPERNSGFSPLFQVMFNYQRQKGLQKRTVVQGLCIESVNWRDHAAEYDLTLDTVEDESGLHARLIYALDLFNADTAARIATHWQNLLVAIAGCGDDWAAATPIDELSLLSGAETRFALNLPRAGGSGESDRYARQPEFGVHQLFEQQVDRTPEAAAILSDSDTWTYAALNARANQLACELRDRGIGVESLVGIALPRSAEMVLGILAVLKAGGAYVSLDPQYPRERLAYLMADSGVALVLTQQSLLAQLPLFHTDGAKPRVQTFCVDRESDWLAAYGEDNLTLQAQVQSLAYVIYTSGTTGKPKGVTVSNAALADHCVAIAEQYGLQASDRILQFASINFDASCEQIFAPLIAGAAIVTGDIPNWSLARLQQEVADKSISVLDLPPFYFSEFAQYLQQHRHILPVRLCVLGGEAWSLQLVRKLGAAFAPQRIVNAYGPTETVISPLLWQCDEPEQQSLGQQPDAAQRIAPIGFCIGDRRAYVLDAALQPVPQGVIGELHIGGNTLARGYLNRAAATAERFVPDPFAAGADAGARLYRTGDLVRYSRDGRIDYIGRADQQIKIRGFRVEPGEIENQLRMQQGVRDSVVIVSATPYGDRLVAYVVRDPAAVEVDSEHATDTFAQTLKHALTATLPNHMVPAQFIAVEQLPLTANGKVDKTRLPLPQWNVAEYVAPSTALQQQLCELWQDVLQREQVGITDNFFELGGDSIVSIQLVSRASDRGMLFTPLDLFRHQTIEALGEFLLQNGEDPAAALADAMAQSDAIASFSLADLAPQQIENLPIAIDNIEDIYPLSPMQQGMLLHTLLEPGSGVYLMQEVYHVNSDIVVPHFIAAWQQVILRHQALRTSFWWDSGNAPLQIVQCRPRDCVEYIDRRHLPAAVQSAELDAVLASERAAGFDLMHEPPFRVRLIQRAEKKFELVLSDHHILLDAWSLAAIIGEFFQLYLGLVQAIEVQLPAAPQYRGFIDWLQRQDVNLARNTWQGILAGFERATPLLSDRTIVAQGESQIADRFEYLDAADGKRLRELASRHHITVNTFTQAAWAQLLCRYSGEHDVVFGVTVAGRPSSSVMQQTVGLFINTIPLRVAVPDVGNTLLVREWLQQLFEFNLTLREYEHLPLQQIQDCSPIVKGERLFNSLLVFENAPIDTKVLSGVAQIDAQFDSRRTHTNYPLTVVCYPGDALGLHLSYDRRFFDADTIELLLAEFKRLLLALADGFDRPCHALPRIAEFERAQLLQMHNDTQRDYPFERGYAALFEEQVEIHGDRVVAQCGADQWTYRQLNRKANRLAHALHAMAPQQDAVIVVLATRNLPLLGMMVGVAKAGAAFLSLDPQLPAARLRQIMQLADCRTIVCTADCAAFLDDILLDEILLDEIEAATAATPYRRPPILVWEDTQAQIAATENLSLPVRADQLAYVIFTSGSTGTPKGAMVHLAGMLNNQLSKIPYLQLDHNDVIAQTASQSFDISVWQFLTAPLCGARTDIVPDEIAHDPQALMKHVQDKGITALESVPSLINTLLTVQQATAMQQQAAPALTSLRWMLPTGEALPPDVARQWLRMYPSVPLINAYGPAECADDVALWQIDAVSSASTYLPIGKPTDNNRLYVLDEALQPVPLRATGELYVAGTGVGRGYLRDARRTSTVFVPDPFSVEPGARLYRTGDLARRRADGIIDYVGRADFQVKIRGFRIELGEIEARLIAHEDVREAVVSVQEFANGKQLVAYVVPAFLPPASAEIDADMQQQLRDVVKLHLKRQLPDYMVPTHVLILGSLPRSANGKIDRRNLPALDISQLQQRYVAPRNDLEATIAAIWREVLSVERVGIEDNFHELGGHSLLATQIVSRLQQALRVSVPLRAMFDYSTVQELAAFVATLGSNAITEAKTSKLSRLMAELEEF